MIASCSTYNASIDISVDPVKQAKVLKNALFATIIFMGFAVLIDFAYLLP
jgi:hypothetical protein